MFPLHYKTRRFFCRVAFALLCLLPTAGVLAWSGWLATSGHTAACRRDIERQTGLVVKLAAVSHPRPGVTIFEGLELADRRSGDRLIYIPRLEVATGNGQRVLIATGPELEERALSRFKQLVEDCWREPAASTTLRASSLTLHSASGALRLKDAEVRLLYTTAGSELKCQFRTESSNAAKLHLVRSEAEPASLLVELDTGGSALPCVWAKAYLPWVAHWGEQAAFEGTWKGLLDQQGWHGEVQGRVTRIDLARAVAANFQHRIDGLAELRIQRASFAQNRLTHIAGAIDAGPGLIGPSLRLAAANALELAASEVALQPDGLLEYEQLAFDFELDSRGLSLRGRCAQGAPGAILINSRHLLLGEPRRQPQPVSAVIRTLAPPTSAWVPATSEAAWLVQLLPPEAAH